MGDYLLMEAADGCGGTWHWNTYPGIAVDIPSFSYQFSFEQSADWTRTYAPGRELKAYAEHCVEKYGLRPKIRFNTKVVSVVFDDESDLWTIETDSGGTVTARFLDQRGGRADDPAAARHRRRRFVRGRDNAHRPLGSRFGPHG